MYEGKCDTTICFFRSSQFYYSIAVAEPYLSDLKIVKCSSDMVTAEMFNVTPCRDNLLPTKCSAMYSARI